MSELTPWNSGSVPERSLTPDEREVILKHLYDRPRLQAQDEKTKMAVEYRVGQTVGTYKFVKKAVTTVVEEQDQITNPHVQAFMEPQAAELVMDMRSDVRAML